MAGSPRWKIYDQKKRYQAACKEIEAAAQLVVWYGTGSTIRDHHGIIVWTNELKVTPQREQEWRDLISSIKT